jgi:hypothetical protein
MVEPRTYPVAPAAQPQIKEMSRKTKAVLESSVEII